MAQNIFQERKTAGGWLGPWVKLRRSVSYPGKNLGACEAGAITTNDEGVAVTSRMLRDHGQAKKYYQDFEG
jgi:hypothetical protein